MLHVVNLVLTPGQTGRLDDQDMLPVPLTSTNLMQDVRDTSGIMVPYFVEGPGSFAGAYAALCEIAEADPGTIGYDETWHPHVRLLGVTQFDNYIKSFPHWAEAKAAPGLVTVPIEFINCNGRHGIVTFQVNANNFGPNITVTRDAGATLGPDTCRSP